MTQYNIPINKGNYSMDTHERDVEFEKNKSTGWEEGYKEYRKWYDYPKSKTISDYPLLVDIELASIYSFNVFILYLINSKKQYTD